MSRLLVLVSRDSRLEGALADAVGELEGCRVFTLRGRQVLLVRPEEPCVVRALPSGTSPTGCARPTVAAAG